MAIDTSAEDMQESCHEPDFQGRVVFAVTNSSISATVIKNRDTIEKFKVILNDGKKFARILKVDKAYYLHYMLPCSEVYLDSMDALDIYVNIRGRSRMRANKAT